MKGIILFDGDCNFCNKSVNFIIDRDRAGNFYFAQQKSPLGKELRKKFAIRPEEDSLILIEDGRSYTQSTAALRICKKLDGLWKILFLLLVLPRPIRDLIYRGFANNRYKWFGRQTSCKLYPPSIQKRFLQ